MVLKKKNELYQHFEAHTNEANQGLETNFLKDHANCGEFIVFTISPHSLFLQSSNVMRETLTSLLTILQLVPCFSRILSLCPPKPWTLLNHWVTISLSCCNHTFLTITPVLSASQCDWADQVLSPFHFSPNLTILDFTAFSISPPLH